MILLLNIYITDKTWSIYDRGRIGPIQDRLDVFMYTLASLAVIPWEHVIIFYKLDTNYQARQSELNNFIHRNFHNAHIFEYRNERQADWKKSLDWILKLEFDDLIWFSCNHDFVFIDYELDLLERICDRMIDLGQQQKYVSCILGGWSESIPYSQAGYVGLGETESFKVTEIDKDYFTTIWSHDDSNQIVNRNLLKAWWYDYDYADALKPRTDMPGIPSYGPYDIHCLHPLREITRHYDGSSHSKIDLNAHAPIFIPDGFFQDDIKVSYCSPTRISGYVHLNPLLPNNSVVDPFGADARWTLEDIPLFWRSRISKLARFDSKIELNQIIAARNESVIKAASQYGNISRTKVIELIEIALRRDSNGTISLNKQAESLDKINYTSIYKKNTFKQPPQLSLLILDRQIEADIPIALTTLNLSNKLREKCEIVWLSSSEKFSHQLLSQVDTLLISNQFKNWSRSTYHHHIILNAGIAQAQAPLICICESNSILNENFLLEVLAQFAENQYEKNIFLRSNERFLLHTSLPNNALNRLSCFVAKKSDLIQVGGFEESDDYLGDNYALEEIIERLVLLGLEEIRISQIEKLPLPSVLFRNIIVTKPTKTVLPKIENEEIKALRTRQQPQLSNKSRANSNTSNKNFNLLLLQFTENLLELKIKETVQLLEVTFNQHNSQDEEFICIAIRDFFAGDRALTLANLEAKLQIYHKIPSYHSLLGVLYFIHGDRRNAKRHLTSSLQLQMHCLSARIGLIEILKGEGDLSSTITVCRDGISLYPNHGYFITNLQEQLKRTNIV